MSRRRKHNAWEDEWEPSSPPIPIEKRQRRQQPQRRATRAAVISQSSSSSLEEPLSPPIAKRPKRPLRRVTRRAPPKRIVSSSSSLEEPLSPPRPTRRLTRGELRPRPIQSPSSSSSSSSESKGKEDASPEAFVVIDPLDEEQPEMMVEVMSRSSSDNVPKQKGEFMRFVEENRGELGVKRPFQRFVEENEGELAQYHGVRRMEVGKQMWDRLSEQERMRFRDPGTGDAMNPIVLDASPRRSHSSSRSISSDKSMPHPFPPDEPADPYAMLIEMGDIVRNMQIVIANERRAFGQNTPLTPEMLDLFNDVEAFVGIVRQQNQVILLSDYLDSLQDYQTRLRRINARILELGRRCLNETDPADPFVDIADLDDTEYIRLENGMCWDIISLYLHIKRFNGANTRGDLQQYPHQQIWSSNEELERILDHPLRNEPSPPELPNGFRHWWDANKFPRLAQVISLETLRRINDFHNLMTNNGPAYDRAVQERMTQAEQEAQRLFKNEYVNNVPSKYREAFKDSELKRQDLFKSDALIEFMQYVENLSPEERDALQQFRPALMNELQQCRNNQLCVYQMGGNMRDLYNKIAALRNDVPPFLPLR